jgi:hypothetical protein
MATQNPRGGWNLRTSVYAVVLFCFGSLTLYGFLNSNFNVVTPTEADENPAVVATTVEPTGTSKPLNQPDLVRNFHDLCKESTQDIMQECSASYLPTVPMNYVSSVAGKDGCVIASDQDENDIVAMLSYGYSFWNTLKTFEKTRIVKGDVSMLQNALRKVQNGECIRIAVFGGSHCRGMCARDIEMYNLGHMLANYLNLRYPGNDCLHSSTGTRFCSGGTPSTIHAYYIRENIQLAGPADITLLEFGNNDLEYESTDFTNLFRFGWALEYIYRKLRETGTAMMFIESSFRIDWNVTSKLFKARNAGPTHIEFQQAYHVPTVSFAPAVLPQFWEQRFNQSSKLYEKSIFADYIAHMQPKGHAIIAAMVMKTFESILSEDPEPFPMPDKLEFIPEEYYKRMEEELIFQVNFNNKFVFGHDENTRYVSGEGRIKMTPEWSITDEGRKNKFGLLSTTPGSYFTFSIPSNAHNLYLTVLKSYEHMGILQVSLQNCKEGYTFETQEIDCLWSSHASQNSVFSMEFEANSCELMKFTVKESGRAENKVKIISLVVT